jgi:hypothetical protein
MLVWSGVKQLGSVGMSGDSKTKPGLNGGVFNIYYRLLIFVYNI